MRTTPQTPGSAPQAPEPSGEMRAPRRAWWRPVWLNRDLAFLFGGRGLRSLTQAYLAVIVPLYLAQLGFSAEQLGIVFTAAAIASAILAAAVGFLSDRFGRKTLLILIALLTVGGGLVFALSGNFVALVLAGALGTIGRGGGAASGGAWGPYYPAEQALIAEHASDRQRTTIFGALSFVGVLTGALGSLLALLPALLQHSSGFSLIAGYRVLFLLTAFLGVAMALIIVPVRERRPILALKDQGTDTEASLALKGQGTDAGGRSELPLAMAGRRIAGGGIASRSPLLQQEGGGDVREPIRARVPRGALGLSHQSWGLIGRFMVTNTTNGLAIGILGGFVVYWFYRRYGVGASEMGGLFFVINLAAALPYLLAGRLARRLGAVNAVVSTRAVSVVLLVVMVFMPTFILAALIYLVRMIANTLSNPVRQSYLMGVIAPHERARAAGLANLPSQAAASVSPYIAGYLIQQIALDLPLELAAALQGLNAILYYAFFRNIHPPEER
jgi:MFS family permease